MTTTSIPSGETPPVTAVGDPIPITELTLTKDDIGLLDFGDDGDQVLGRLAATFGDPTQDTGFIVGNGSWGECAGDAIRVVQWGPLIIVVKENGGQPVRLLPARREVRRHHLAPHRHRDQERPAGHGHGGAAEGDLRGFLIDFAVHEEVGLVFELRSQLGADLLLWGPVESPERRRPGDRHLLPRLLRPHLRDRGVAAYGDRV